MVVIRPLGEACAVLAPVYRRLQRVEGAAAVPAALATGVVLLAWTVNRVPFLAGHRLLLRIAGVDPASM